MSKYYLCCNPEGVRVKFNSCFQSITFETAFIRHYRTKTIGEWIKNIMKRGDVFYSGEKAREILSLDFFFRYNKKTEEKVKYAETLMKSSLTPIR